MKDRDINFFQPVWRRAAVTAVCVIWAGLEIHGRDATWIAITIGLTAYAVWTLFVTFPRGAPVAEPVAAAAVPASPESNDVPPQT